MLNFLLHKQGDLYFLLHNNSVHVIHFNLKKILKKVIGRKNDIAERLCTKTKCNINE